MTLNSVYKIESLENIFNELVERSKSNLTGSFNEIQKLENDNISTPYEEKYEVEDLFYDRDEIVKFNPSGAIQAKIAAVDVGATKIGETSDGALVAFRGCIIIMHLDRQQNLFYRTGPILLSNTYKVKNLHLIGQQLGDDSLFVKLDNNTPIETKSGAADNINQYSDRIRNLIERKLQERAASLISNGFLLIDGALTRNTRDTPIKFIEENILRNAFSHHNRVIAISKKSTLQVKNVPIHYLLDDHPNKACFRNIQRKLDESSNSSNKRNFGEMYVTRFSEYGPTFRVDVCVENGDDCRAALQDLWSICGMRNGYPEPLVRAHIHTYIPWSKLTSMRAEAIVRYGIRKIQEVDFGGAFAPFGGGFK
ncbi:hypothetical protein CEN49_07805 [Fischerella thermalis CCMEE 5273]|nr:hypothetical protein CEN49_07805 [Fischerella thermalis CCMEE 5273]